MKCKIKECCNTVEEDEKYCKYHLIKRNSKNRKIIAAVSIITSLSIVSITGIKKYFDMNKNFKKVQ
ncbi:MULTISPECIES: hypothetical protein [Clostridium]|uniref:DUF1540 domain-containing protein n=1 Tax=Clostridium aquiflavi TaxID=3073603 RepID=A0ABU1EGJ4_9CLOT|nr:MULTISPECIES: hypothetical protein [unclassified Clostridium]MDR5587237.1 hypothetical protein [Clostridium sp. 5N-1]NFG61652.1 hypothetical protein [Clostridium botulinum]NFQ08437.1 hypothetical protein [Clostridium botulinum]